MPKLVRQWNAANMKIRRKISSLLGDLWLSVVLWCEVAHTALKRSLIFLQLMLESIFGFQTLTKTAWHFLFNFLTVSVFGQDSPLIYSARKYYHSAKPEIIQFLYDVHQTSQPASCGWEAEAHRRQDVAPCYQHCPQAHHSAKRKKPQRTYCASWAHSTWVDTS